MPLKYKIFEDRKLVYVIGKNRITYDDLMTHMIELSKDPKYKSPMKKLINYLDATLVELTREESQNITDIKASLNVIFKKELCAFIVNSDVDFGISRVHGAKIESAQIHTNVFRDIKSALSWLDVDLTENEIEI